MQNRKRTKTKERIFTDENDLRRKRQTACRQIDSVCVAAASRHTCGDNRRAHGRGQRHVPLGGAFRRGRGNDSLPAVYKIQKPRLFGKLFRFPRKYGGGVRRRRFGFARIFGIIAGRAFCGAYLRYNSGCR